MPTRPPTQPGAPTVLVVDDEPPIVDSLQKIFERESLRVLTAGSGGEALEILRREPVSVLLTDLMMPGMSGMDLLRASKSIAPETETVLMTAYGTVENAVEAMKQGAYDFVTKPIKRAHLVRVVGKAIEKRSLVQENRSLRAQLAAEQRRALIGQSLAWRRTMEIVMQAAPSQATVLLLGESGTGKELLARAIHDSSPRAGGPFVPVNCAALPETILEAELFGYEKGAFTGADPAPRRAVRAGRRRHAVSRRDRRDPDARPGEAPARAAGGGGRAARRADLKVDLRLVAATNQDLRAAVREGRFREDLYYRLNVIAVPIPPLRDRRDDIPLLAEHFLQRYAARNNRHLSGFSRAAAEALARHEWPGNVRELENTVERAVVLSRGTAIEIDDLPPEVRSGGGVAGDGRTLSFVVGTPLEEIERRVIHATLAHVGRRQAPLRAAPRHRHPHDLPAARRGTGAMPEPASRGRRVRSRRRSGRDVPNWQGSQAGGSR